MASRKKSPAVADRPLLPDELAMRPEPVATAEPPDEVRRALAETRLHVSGLSRRAITEQLDGGRGDAELVLPDGVRLGRSGRTGERLDRATVVASLGRAAGEHTGTTPNRPAWMTESAQPRLASEFAGHEVLRRADGTRLEPYYGVYGSDDRHVYYPGSYPWNCVGRIFTWTNWAGGGGWTWWGSGVLVGPRHVLTAGHVCPWGAKSWAMKFVPGYWNGSPASGAGAMSFASDFRGWNTNDHVAAHDMAVLRLYEPVGSWLGWMGTKTYSSSWEGGNYWTLAGYPAAVAGGERPSYQSGIPVLDDDDDGDAKELEHHGDATGGDSGGPFFGFWNDGPYAVGTTSGGERISGTPFGWWDEDNNIEAGGRALVDLVRWGLSNWP